MGGQLGNVLKWGYMKKTIIWVAVIIIIVLGVYLMTRPSANDTVGTTDGTATSSLATVSDTVGDKRESVVIGKSVEGRDITAYNYGTGGTKLLFVGGIHGGYEWNTVLLAYQLMDYLKANPTVIPKNIQVTVIPVLNPDGLNKVVGTAGRFTVADVSASQSVTIAGRFNAKNVDLSRNFDCDWQAEGVWQNRAVSGGTAAFSEPESQALKNYVETNKLAAAVVWYSAADGVFASHCGGAVAAETTRLTGVYAQASGYPPFNEFTAYKVTGDAVNWLAKENIPAISVLLVNHTDTDWDKNLTGVKAMLNLYTK